jgi:uncharacterized protein YsxB (DUF464 family)
MIEIVGRYEPSVPEFELTVTGHAGYNPGNDIVCAAVSCLTQSLAAYLDRRDLHAELSECEIGRGCAIIRVQCDMQAREAMLLFQTGAELLAQTYPEHVRTDIVGW